MDVVLATAIVIITLVVTGLVYALAKYQTMAFSIFAIILNLLSVFTANTITHTDNFCSYDSNSSVWNCTTYKTYENNKALTGIFITNIILLSVIIFFKMTAKGAEMMS